MLPYPSEWNESMTTRKIKISPLAAKEFLSTYKSYSSEVELAFYDWIPDIRLSLN
jgi:hypothetical protein